MRELAYKLILDRAVRFANQDPRKPWYLGGDTFRPPASYTHLELWYEPELVKGGVEYARQHESEIRTEEEVIRDLAIIVRDAVQQAIAEESVAFGALIISQARDGRDPDSWFN